jgi:hypothetical protein
MRQFDRCLQQIDDTAVLITSWWEPEEKIWHASAPQLLHVIHKLPISACRGNTRAQAIQSLTTSLAKRVVHH